jgi:hypothetical protein
MSLPYFFSERRLQRDLHRVRIDHFGLLDAVEHVVALELVRRIGDAVEVRFHRGGVEVGAVLELHAVAQLERVDLRIRAGFVAIGQHVDQLHVLVEPEQPLIERLGDGLRERVVGIVRIERREGRGDGHHGRGVGMRRIAREHREHHRAAADQRAQTKRRRRDQQVHEVGSRLRNENRL